MGRPRFRLSTAALGWTDNAGDTTGYAAQDLMLDLEPFVRADNLDLSVYWPGMLKYARQVGQMQPHPIGLAALPDFTVPLAMLVNLGHLDQLGLKYPEPDWTHKDWAKLWKAATVKPSGTHPGVAGVLFNGDDLWVGYDHDYALPGAWVMHGFGGEFADPNDLSRCILNRAGSIAAGEWGFDVVWSGASATGNQSFVHGTVATQSFGGDNLATAAQQFRSLKWDLFPLPIWPVNPTTYSSTDSMAIWADTKYPEAAWTVLKYLSYGKTWQRMKIRAVLLSPSRRDMVEEWVSLVRAYAPPLRDKNLEVWGAQAHAGQQYVGNLFPYSTAEVQNIISHWSGLLNSRKVTVAEAFTAAAKQIDAVEAVGKAVSANFVRSMNLYKAGMARALAAPATYRFPAPSRTGAGSPPVVDAAQVMHRGDTWTVTGGGGGIAGAVDGITFACAPTTATRATFTCRITSIQAVKPDTLTAGARFGLMVRADLSDDAASLGIEVSAQRGVHTHTQVNAASSMADQQPGGGGENLAGLLPASAILTSSATAANFLTRPVWLRLVRNVNAWTAYTSLDGHAWTQAGSTLAAQLLGGWVGLYVTAHNNGALVRATFEHVQGFTPDTFVRIGAP